MIKNSLQQGQMAIMLIIAVIVVGSFFMVGGFGYPNAKPETTHETIQPTTEPTPQTSSGTSSSTSVVIASQENTCSHLDGICHPLAEALCCDRVRALCSNAKCTGYLPPESSYQAGNPTPTIDPQCGVDQMCKSFCGNKEGFLCL